MSGECDGTGAAHTLCRHRGPKSPGRLTLGAAVLASLLIAALGLASAGEGAPPAAGPAAAPAAAPAAPVTEQGQPIEVSDFKLMYPGQKEAKDTLYEKQPGLPKLEEVAGLVVTLGKLPDGYAALRSGVEAVSFALADVPKQPLKKFYPSAILSIEEQMVKWFNARRLLAVFVVTHPEDVLLTLSKDKKTVTGIEDNRGARKDLRLVIWIGVVTKVRTVSSGSRVPQDKRVDHPLNARIRERSPVQPWAAGGPNGNDLLNDRELNRYTYFLSRYPGRRVDVSLSSAEKPGAVVLDYLVTENRPWYAYMQASNTGTRYTRPWRERFGFIHNQLTNHDDTLTLDYTTAGFDVAHAVTVSYEVPVFQFDRLRWRTYASWSEYTASDVGIASAEFVGESRSVGMEFVWNFFQHRATFVDSIVGVRCERERVEDKLLAQEGDARFLVPYVGLRLQRLTEVASTLGSVTLEWNCTRAHNPDVAELEKLGRSKPDQRYHILKYDFSHSFYIEPFLLSGAWESPDPSKWWKSTLAHELAFAVRGQHSMGRRLIPQDQMVIGGAYTVRGYPESVAVGDSACVASAEYRFHLPRLFKPTSVIDEQRRQQKKEPMKPAKLPVFDTPFRFAPQQVYGRPDWDFVLLAFYDVGRVETVHKQVFEVDRTLHGTGVGAELRIKDNFSIRCDYGVALDDVEDPATGGKRWRSGDHRFHTICTLAF